jgi:hypothetical protein
VIGKRKTAIVMACSSCVCLRQELQQMREEKEVVCAVLWHFDPVRAHVLSGRDACRGRCARQSESHVSTTV